MFRPKSMKVKVISLDNSDLEKLAACNVESDNLQVILDVWRDGLISRRKMNDLVASSHSTKVGEWRMALLKCVHTELQGRLTKFEKVLMLPPCQIKLEAAALAKHAEREELISKDVVDHLTSLLPQVPDSMRLAYLHLCVHETLLKKLDKHCKRCSKIVGYKLSHESTPNPSGVAKGNARIPEPLKFAYVAKENGSFPEFILKYLCSLYPKALEYDSFKEFDSLGFELQYSFEVVNRKLHELMRLKESGLVMNFGLAPLKNLFSSSKTLEISDFSLQSDHLSELTELLVSYAYKWKNIGIALNFKPEDLRCIEANPLLLVDGPASYMGRLLEDWLLMKFAHTLSPTVSNLEKALKSNTVGLGVVASDIWSVLGKNLQTNSYLNLPYCVITASFTAMEWSVFPKHDDLYLKESQSTLLEIQTTTNDCTIDYEWLIDGIQLNSKPIMCLHKVDIGFGGKELFCILRLHDQQIHTIPISIHVSCELDMFRADLASMYLAQPEVPKDTWPPVANHKYINLALIKGETVAYNSEMVQSLRGDMDDILQEKENIEYAEVYDSLKSGQLILVEGRPGSGKTTFVHKITRDWAIDAEGPIRLLLLVSLRVLNTLSNPDLSDILNFFKDLKVSKELIEQRSGKGIGFIFDGFDEFSPPNGEDSIVYKIINKTYLHHSTVIVASRPAAVARLRSRADKAIEVLGFMNDQILKYMLHYPFSPKSKSLELKAYLSAHPNVLNMCYLPIHATMVAFLYQVLGNVPKTETDMYTHFTRSSLIRSLSKYRGFEPVDIDIQNLSGREYQCYKQICQLAFEKTVSEKQDLHQDEISSFEKDIDISLGLITIDRTAGLYGYKNIYTFLHLTFQEYLAACHITTLSDESQLQTIQEHGGKNHMLVVWKFFCGLMKLHGNKFKSIIRSTKRKTLHHIQLAYESQQQLACVELLEEVNYHIQLLDKYFSSPDFTAIGYVTNTTVRPVRITLQKCSFSKEGTDALLEEMEVRARRLVQHLHIGLNIVDNAYMESLGNLLLHLGPLKYLFVDARQSQTEFSGFPLVSGCQFAELREFFLVNIDIRLLCHPKDLYFPNVRKFSYKRSKKSNGGIKASLKHKRFLEKLANDVRMSAEAFQQKIIEMAGIEDIFPHLKSLETLEFFVNNVKMSAEEFQLEAGIEDIFPSLESLKTLEFVNDVKMSAEVFQQKIMDQAGIEDIFPSPKSLDTLEFINDVKMSAEKFQQKIMKRAGITAIATSNWQQYPVANFRHSESLENLAGDVMMSSKGIQQKAIVIRSIESSKCYYLDEFVNDVEMSAEEFMKQAGICEIVAGLKDSKFLEELDMTGNTISKITEQLLRTTMK